MSNIVGLKIKNFLSISDVEIKPGGNVIQIVGGNNQGKTSILKAIEFAIKGSSDGSLVKFGQESAEVIVELDDETVVRRRLTKGGKASVDVKKGGFIAPTPQSYLDALFEHSAFNPLELLDVKKRTEAILQAIPIKLTEELLKAELNDVDVPLPPIDYNLHGLKVIDQAHKYFYQRRAEANKDAETKKKRWETYKADLPKIDESVQNRVAVEDEICYASVNYEQSINEARSVQMLHASAKKAVARVTNFTQVVDSIDDEIQKAEAHIQALRARKEEGQKFIEQAKAEVPTSLPDESQAIEDRNKKLNALNEAKAKLQVIEKNAAVEKQYSMVEDMKKEYETARAFADSLTKRVNLLGGEIKWKLMSQAEMPIDGLTYAEGVFLVDGVPVDNLSSSKALKLAVGVARKLAKKTKIVCIDGAECLDELMWKSLHEEIKDDGFTYFVSRVGEAFAAHEGDHIIPMQEGHVAQ